MVHLQLGSSNAQIEHSNSAVLQAAKQIAKRCNAVFRGESCNFTVKSTSCCRPMELSEVGRGGREVTGKATCTLI